MKLAIDVMGFENELIEPIKACRQFLKHHKDVEFILVGQELTIKQLLKPSDKFTVVHANNVVKMTDHPLTVLRDSNTSMYKAIELVKTNQADGVLSAGSTISYVPLCYNLIGLLPNIKKPAFMPYLPTCNKNGMMMLDVGANKECTGEDLHQFAIMSTIYSQEVRHIANPKVSIINIGTEVEKGFKYQQEAYQLMKNDKSLNFQGFIEPRDLLNGVVDIAIADGYTGNITLKSLEGGLSALKHGLINQYKKPYNWLGAMFSLLAIKGLSKTFDYKNNAGALVLGLKKIAVKTHGNASRKEFYSSIKMLYDSVGADIISKISNAMSKK